MCPNSSGREIEDRGHASSSPASGSRHHARSKSKTGVVLGVSLAAALLTVALVNTFYTGGDSGGPNQASRPPPTNPSNNTSNATQPAPAPQTNIPPRGFVELEERDLGRDADALSEPYPNLHPVDDIADGVFTTAGSSEARSISGRDG